MPGAPVLLRVVARFSAHADPNTLNRIIEYYDNNNNNNIHHNNNNV
jgi:hypothetical protein